MKTNIRHAKYLEDLKEELRSLREHKSTLTDKTINTEITFNYLNTIKFNSLIKEHILHEYQKLEIRYPGLGLLLLDLIFLDSILEIEEKEILSRSTVQKMLGSVYSDVAEILDRHPAPIILKENDRFSIEFENGALIKEEYCSIPQIKEIRDFSPILWDGKVISSDDKEAIINFCSQTNKEVVLFCFSDSHFEEMKNIRNFRAIVFQLSERNVNIMNDLSSLFNCSPVISPRTGNTLESVAQKLIQQNFESLSLSDGEIEISSVSASPRHIEYLISKKKNADIQDIAEIFQHRIENLRSGYWKILCPKNKLVQISNALTMLSDKKRVYYKIKDIWYPGDAINLLNLRAKWIKSLIENSSYEIVHVGN